MLNAVPEAKGRAQSFLINAGQVRDDAGAGALLDDWPKAQWLLSDGGYDAN